MCALISSSDQSVSTETSKEWKNTKITKTNSHKSGFKKLL